MRIEELRDNGIKEAELTGEKYIITKNSYYDYKINKYNDMNLYGWQYKVGSAKTKKEAENKVRELKINSNTTYCVIWDIKTENFDTWLLELEEGEEMNKNTSDYQIVTTGSYLECEKKYNSLYKEYEECV